MPEARRKVLLVGWDAADWKVVQPLLDRGEMPVLERIVHGGVMGDLTSTRPMLSPMLWNSIATGKRPFKHGVCGFTEVDAEWNRVVPISSVSRKCKAIWQMLNERGLKTHVVGWFVTHPAEPIRGACVSDRYASPAPEPGGHWPLPRGTIFPERLVEALAAFRVRPEEITGDVLAMFVRDLGQINRAHDKHLHQLARQVAEAFSIPAAATYLLEHEPWDFAAIYYRALDRISHDFMRFHPPRMRGVYEDEFQRYSDVVNSAYRLHDLMLGRLLQLAGDDATVLVVSDHGFKSDHRRPHETSNLPAAIADWHRLKGVLAMRGPGLRKDELIFGANLLDLTPTILALFGLPMAADMDGRVLAEAFAEPPEVRRIESWETTADAKSNASSPMSADENARLIRQFVELGYIQRPGEDPQEAVRATTRENNWNLAQAYLDAARFADALPLLEGVYEEWPERADYCIELALCQSNLGMNDEAEETINSLPRGEGAGAQVLRAGIAYRRGNNSEAVDHLSRAKAENPTLPGLQNQMGLARLRLQQVDAAEEAFRRARDLDPEDFGAHLGIAQCLLRRRNYEGAVEAALTAIGLRYHLPLAHYQLGVALARLGNVARAIQAFENCLRFQPTWTRAHRYLGRLYARQPGGEDVAAKHRALAKGRADRLARWQQVQQRLRNEAAERAKNRSAARQLRRERASVPDVREALPEKPLEFLLVSGLPRSGTSLMMQILEAGRLPIMRDELRPADEANPRGYFEWQAIKRLPRDPALIEKAHGKVTKVISMLLPSLPRKHRFRIIFMIRDIEEVAASQSRLRARLTGGETASKTPTPEALREHRERILALLRRSSNVELLEVSYADLLEEPVATLERVAAFAAIDAAFLPVMAKTIDPALRHFSTAAA